MHNFLELRVNDILYSGWKSIRIKRSIQTISGSFQLSVTDRWALSGRPWEIREGNECSILLNNKPILTGFVDKRSVSLSGDSHSITIEGRDRTRNLVDGCVDLGAWQFTRIPTFSFLKKLCAFYGISVSLGAGATLPPIPEGRISINVGDTGFQVLERITKYAGLLPVSDGHGGVNLIVPGSTAAPVGLVEGENILKGKSEFSQSERFGKYIVIGQSPSSTLITESSSTHVRAEAKDTNVDQTRVTIIRADRPVTQKKAQQRAAWEMKVAVARSDRLLLIVQGWDAKGYIWNPGDLVSVNAPTLGVKGTMMISSTELSLESSEETAIELLRPDAFSQLPVSERKWKQ